MNPKFLIVDDDRVNRELISASLGMLRLAKSEVFEAANGHEAIEIALREKPTMIFLDIKMPMMSGIEVCEVIKNTPAFTDTTIVMVSCKDDSLDFRRAER